MNLYLENGQRFTLPIQNRIGEGGEATVYRLAGSDVVKLYHSASAAHLSKLRAMIANPPSDPCEALDHVSIAWPKALVFQNRSCHARDFVGFTMPQIVDAQSVFKCYNPGERRNWPNFTYRYLLGAARNLASAMAAVHDCGYVVGDINESNILVSDRALVSLIDTDSFQVSDGASEQYLCRVGKPDYTPPELTSYDGPRTEYHDRFGLTVLIFQLLMEGTHPFQVRWTGPGQPPDITGKIRQNLFPYTRKPPRHCKAPPIAPPFTLLAPKLRAMMLDCFRDGHRSPKRRPSAREWQEAIDRELGEITQCSDNTNHEFGKHLKTCPWCERRSRLGGRDPYPGAHSASTALPAQKPITQIPLATSGRAQPIVHSAGTPFQSRKRHVRRAVAVAMPLASVTLCVAWQFRSATTSEVRSDVQPPLPNPAVAARKAFSGLQEELEQLRKADTPVRTAAALEAIQGFKAAYPDYHAREIDELTASWTEFQLAEDRLTKQFKRLGRGRADNRPAIAFELISKARQAYPGFDLTWLDAMAMAIETQSCDELALEHELRALRLAEDEERSATAIRALTDFQSTYPERDSSAIAHQIRQWQELAAADLELDAALDALALSKSRSDLVNVQGLLQQRMNALPHFAFDHFHRRLQDLEKGVQHAERIAQLEKSLKTIEGKMTVAKRRLAEQLLTWKAEETKEWQAKHYDSQEAKSPKALRMYSENEENARKRKDEAIMQVEDLSAWIGYFATLIQWTNDELCRARKLSGDSPTPVYQPSMMSLIDAPIELTIIRIPERSP